MTFTKPEKSLVWSLVVGTATATLMFADMPKVDAARLMLGALVVVNFAIWIPFPGRDWRGRFLKGWKR